MSEKDEIIRLINDLECWEFDRMSSSGKETMIELQKLLGMPINKEEQ
jgi:hypothetical protein